MAVAAILALGFLNPFQNWGDDWAQYILQAKALHAGTINEYVAQNAFMIRESAGLTWPLVYPWGLPIALAVAGALFGFTLLTFKILNIAVFVGLVFALYVLGSRLTSTMNALALAMMVAFNPGLLHYCNHVLSELPFTLATLGAFVLMERQSPAGLAGTARRSVAIGAAIFVAVTFRLAAALLLPAAVVRELMRYRMDRRRPSELAAAIASITLAFLLPYAASRLLLPDGSQSYLAHLTGLSWQGVMENARMYPVEVFQFFGTNRFQGTATVLLTPLVVWGAISSWRRTLHLTAYVLVTLAVYAVWPMIQHYRFMIPLTPIVAMFVIIGADDLARRLDGARARLVFGRLSRWGIPVLFLSISTVLVSTRHISNETWQPYDASSTEMFDWVKRHTPPQAVMSFFKPRAMQLLGDRLSLTEYPGDVRKADYLVYAKPTDSPWNLGQLSLETLRRAAPLEPAFENATFVVYRIGTH